MPLYTWTWNVLCVYAVKMSICQNVINFNKNDNLNSNKQPYFSIQLYIITSIDRFILGEYPANENICATVHKHFVGDW